jgi:hypothetical protein
MWNRWPLIDKEVIRLEVANIPVYSAICWVCIENDIREPLSGEDVRDSGDRIEAELQAQADAESG